MSDLLSEIHEEVDRMTEKELVGLKEFLATYPDRLGSVLRNAPWDDEPETEEERKAVAEAEEWLEQNGGEGIPHEEVCREFGFEPAESPARIQWTRHATSDIRKISPRDRDRILHAVERLAKTDRGV